MFNPDLVGKFPLYDPKIRPFCEIMGGFDEIHERGYTPLQIRRAYGLKDNETGVGKKIALIFAYSQPNLQNDLDVFSETFNLPKKTLEMISFAAPFTGPDYHWAIEANLDVQWAHAIAPDANLIIIFSKSTVISDMFDAIEHSLTLGANIVSMSWGTEEFTGQRLFEDRLRKMVLEKNVIFTASSGDTGGVVFYPAVSEYVIGVGGTTLFLDKLGRRIGEERAWINGGGGTSVYLTIPPWQRRFYNINEMTEGFRGTPDSAFLADPNTGVALYMSSDFRGNGGWTVSGGTSIGSPCMAGILASAKHHKYPEHLYNIAGKYFYNYPQYYFNDITQGNNINFYAKKGYDFCTGLGTPISHQIINS